MAARKCQAETESCFGGGSILLRGDRVPLCNLINHTDKNTHTLRTPIFAQPRPYRNRAWGEREIASGSAATWWGEEPLAINTWVR